MANDLMKELDKARVGRRIALVRRVMGTNQEEFAAKAKLTRTLVTQYENGVKLPSVKAATKLCIAYKLNLDFIFHGDYSGLRGRTIDAIKALMAADGADD